MASGKDAKRPVLGQRIVEVDPESDDPPQRIRGRVRIQHAFLFGPRPPARSLEPRSEREGGVLMPYDQPVGSRGLVEQGGTIRDGRLAEPPSGNPRQSSVVCQRGNLGHIHQVPGPRAAPLDAPPREAREKPVALGRRQYAPQKLESPTFPLAHRRQAYRRESPTTGSLRDFTRHLAGAWNKPPRLRSRPKAGAEGARRKRTRHRPQPQRPRVRAAAGSWEDSLRPLTGRESGRDFPSLVGWPAKRAARSPSLPSAQIQNAPPLGGAMVSRGISPRSY